MNVYDQDREDGFEPQFGLPEPLPDGEELLWQCSPSFKSLIKKVFLFRLILAYFVIMLASSFYFNFQTSGFENALIGFVGSFFLSVFCLLSVAFLAYLSSKTTVYSITNKRIVMRIGIVLTLTFNIPYKEIDAADLKLYSDSTGDISFRIKPSTKIAFIHLWPHCRFKSFSHPEPALRCIEQAKVVSEIVCGAWTKEVKQNEKTLSSDNRNFISNEYIENNQIKVL
ncbi:MAG: hypothetical protein CBD16_01045 [Betaproteobacteria bacterium TMED156]|nr:MAG: hypothetical protein CBD16_01045 [Betaproteobacteria bacterium TMED156]|tara:strand:- start:299 stop:976 length:678 start_codon:yes stop_codon:yes gene_type:complete